MSEKEGERFLGRWARLKQEKAATEVAPKPASPAGQPAEPPGAASATVPAGSPAEDTPPLPAIDDLTADSDITGFLRKGVSEELQRLALRRIWSLDPAIRDFIEMAENQYDWNVPGGVPGFGEIAPGTDITALLAQATGAGNRALPEASPDAIAAADGSGRTGTAPGIEARTPEPSPVRRQEVAAASPEPGPEAVPAGERPDADPSSEPESGSGKPEPEPDGHLPRRRHGGALPV